MKVLMILALAAIVYCAKAATLNKRDVKSELLTRAAALEKDAAAEATKLRANGRTTAADNLERDAKRLAAVARELEHALPLAIIPLELELGVIERRIAEEIKLNEALTGTSGPKPTGSSPRPQPTGSSPRPQPTGSSPKPQPTGSSPRSQPTVSSPRPQPTGSPPTGTPGPQPTGSPPTETPKHLKFTYSKLK